MAYHKQPNSEILKLMKDLSGDLEMWCKITEGKVHGPRRAKNLKQKSKDSEETAKEHPERTTTRRARVVRLGGRWALQEEARLHGIGPSNAHWVPQRELR